MAAIPSGDAMASGRVLHLLRPPLAPPNPDDVGEPRVATPESRLRSQLRLLAVVRGVAVALQIGTICVMVLVFDALLPLPPLLITAAALIAFEIALLHRLGQSYPVTQGEFFRQLMIDIAWLSISLYWTGGSTHNPFADLFVVYVGMAALVLNWRYVCAAVPLGMVPYAILQAFHHPLHYGELPTIFRDFDSVAHAAHFALMGVVVGVFGYRIAQINRRYWSLVAATREAEARNESAIDLASLAAGAAHEMGTPLTTIAVLVGDMRRGKTPAEEVPACLEAIGNAVQACKRSLFEMVATVGADRLPERHKQDANEFMRQVVDRFQQMRPKVAVKYTSRCDKPAVLHTGAAMRQSVLGLLANAADASPEQVEATLTCSPEEVHIEILDRGPGIPPEILEQLGTRIVTTKPVSGNGMGIFLANLNFSRMGGRLELRARDGGGTCARVTLPANSR